MPHATPVPKQRHARRAGCQESHARRAGCQENAVPSSAPTQQRPLWALGRAGLRFHLRGLGATGPGAPSPSYPTPEHPREGLTVAPLPLRGLAEPVTRGTAHRWSREVALDSPPAPGTPRRAPSAPSSQLGAPARVPARGGRCQSSGRIPRFHPPLPGESSRGRGAAGPAGARGPSFTP